MTISELYDWFRSERFSATHNELYEIMLQGTHADTLNAATLLLARIRMNMGNVDAAVMQLGHASMQSVEDTASRHALMALGYAFKRCFGLAEQSLQEARPAGSAQPFVDLCEAMVRCEQGRLLTAASLFEKCLGDHADRRFAFKGLSEVQRAAGDPSAARKTLDRLLELESQWAGTHRALAYHALATQRFDEAAAHMQEAIQAAPDGDFLLPDTFTLGRCHNLAGRRDEAQAIFEQLISGAPEPPFMVMRAMQKLRGADPADRLHVISRTARVMDEQCQLPPSLDLFVRLLGHRPSPPTQEGPTFGPLVTYPGDVLGYLEQEGFQVLIRTAGADLVTALLDRDLPVLLFGDPHLSGQASVVIGHDPSLDEITLVDPLTGLHRQMPVEALEGPMSPPMIAAAHDDDPASVEALEGADVQTQPHVALVARADVHRDAGHGPEAETLYRKAIDASSSHIPAHDGLLSILFGVLAQDPTEADPNRSFNEALEQARNTPDAGPVVHKFQGRMRALQGQHKRAVASFRKALSAIPDEIHVICEQATSLLLSGSDQEAAGKLRDALSLAPHHPRPNLDMADFHVSYQDLDAAEHHARCGLDLAPDSAYGHEILARVHRARGELEEALAQIETAARLGSDTDWLHSEKGLVLMDLGRHEEAVDEMEIVLSHDASNTTILETLVQTLAVLERGEEALKRARALETLQPGEAVTHEMLGLALATAGETESAEKAYVEALSREPGRLTCLERLGHLLESSGRGAETIQMWLAAARRDPSHPEVLTRLAEALRTEGQDDAVAAILRRAAMVGGGPAASMLEQLRASYMESEDPVQMLEDASKQAGEDEAVILAELGRMLLLAGDPRASSVYRDVSRLEPSDPTVLAMMAHAMRREVAAMSQEGEQPDPQTLATAAEIMDQALQMEPYWVWGRAERAFIALDMGKPDLALEVLQPVTENMAQVWKARMLASSRLQKHDVAARAADMWLHASGDDLPPESLVMIASAHARAGNEERAVELGERVLEKIPEGPSPLRTQVENILGTASPVPSR